MSILSNFPAGRPAPIVGENGNWWVWNEQTRVYVDSGKPSRGETGARGAQGPQGPAGATGPQGPKGDPGGPSDVTLGLLGASVGQTVKIKTVDANGKPTVWEAADMASGNDWTTIIDTTLESDVSRLFYGNLAYKEVELWLEWDSAQSMKLFYALNVPNASANMGEYHNVQDTSARSIGAFYMKAFINPHRKVCSAYAPSLYGGVNKTQVAQLNMLISSFGAGLVPVDRITSDNITSISFANADTDGVIPAGTRVVLRGR